MILLTCAVEAELGFWEARAGVETLVTGVGPVEAASAIAAAAAAHRYDLIVNAGVAGAFEGAAQVGDGVVVVDDVMEIALEDSVPFVLPEGEQIVNKAYSDPTLVARLGEGGFPVLHGITVARVTATEATAQRLVTNFGVQVETMEGFAALRAAARAGIPAIEVRGVSNRCGERARSGWNLGAGIAGLARVVEALLDLCAVKGERSG